MTTALDRRSREHVKYAMGDCVYSGPHMVCPECSLSNPAGAVRCQKCATPLSDETLAEAATVAAGWSAAAAPGAEDSDEGGFSEMEVLHPGTVLGERYEILQLLGTGGMGAVYKARDRELDRIIALKVIRPELAGRSMMLRRFKLEIILARKITHKNVIRIFDLGQADGTKFITMEYVEGQDLKTLLQDQGKLAPQQAAAVIQQVCRALEAAHAEGVVHRDLKPSNVLVDARGKVTVMDFGIAHSMEGSGQTRTGMMLGTPDYMSPEQAMGQKIDARSDLFAVGIIFYELLTGKLPFEADTAMGTIIKRIEGRATPATELDRSIPPALSNIVGRCLEKDPQARYQSAVEVIEDLEAWRGGTQARSAAPAPAAWFLRPKWLALAAIPVVAVLAWLLRDRFRPEAAQQAKAVTLLVADFDNETTDAVFDGTLEPMFVVAMEGASFVNSFNRAQARALARQVRPGAARLSEDIARLVAAREGIDVVLAGSISRQGPSYAVAVKAVDAATGKLLAAHRTSASSKEKVLSAVGKLAAPIRKSLGDTTPESAQIAAAETFTASSLEAAHAYSSAQEVQLAGKVDEAIQGYAKAAELDPDLGRAYSGLAVLYRNVGQTERALQYFELALKHLDRMSEREKYRTRGTYFVTKHDYGRAIDEFSALVKQFPADTAGHANLAIAYLNSRNIPKAQEEGRKAIEIYPRNVAQRNNFALFLLYGGDFERAAKEADGVLQLNPRFEKAFVVQALSQLAQGQPARAVEIYLKVAKLSARGATYAAMGLADVALYEGRVGDAVPILEEGAVADQAGGNKAGAAEKTAVLAEALLLGGKLPAALQAADRALALSRKEPVVLGAAHVYLEAGREPKARALAKELGAALEPEIQSYGRLIDGEADLKRRQVQSALRSFSEAKGLFDTWLAHYHLGRAYLEGGAFARAGAEFEQCLKRRGEVTALLFDEVPTYRLLPPVYYYLGRAQEGLKPGGGDESYRAFLAMRQTGEPDALVQDARRRLPGR